MLNPPRSILLGWAREAILLGPRFILINYSKHILLGYLILILIYYFEVKMDHFIY